MRHTKIIATVGPASDSGPVLDALLAAGTDVIRLNVSHGTHESQAATFARVRQAAARAKREVAILQDLGGPKIRTGVLQGGRALQVEAGDALRISTGDLAGGRGRIFTAFAGHARGRDARRRLRRPRRADTRRDHPRRRSHPPVRSGGHARRSRRRSQAIVAATRGGSTARRLSTLRPRAPILATTSRADTARRLALHWGVMPVHIDLGDHVDLAGS